MKKIIDISHYNKIVDKDKFYSRCDFVIVKAVQGTKLEENHNKESVAYLKTVVKECEKRKKPYWIYVFLDKGHEVAQAKFMVKVCSSLIGKYFVGYVLDIESQNDEDSCIKALAYIKKHSKKQMIYTMYSQYSKYKRLIAGRGTRCAWWEARYGKNDGTDTSKQYPCHKNVDLHQYTSEGKFDCLEGSVDVSKLNGNKELSFFKGDKKKKTYSGSFPILPSRKFFKIGDKGAEVVKLQKFLIWGGFNVGKTGADGIYGVNTSKAVLSYKKAVGLTPNDGNFGVKCLEKAKTVKK